MFKVQDNSANQQFQENSTHKIQKNEKIIIHDMVIFNPDKHSADQIESKNNDKEDKNFLPKSENADVNQVLHFITKLSSIIISNFDLRHMKNMIFYIHQKIHSMPPVVMNIFPATTRYEEVAL